MHFIFSIDISTIIASFFQPGSTKYNDTFVFSEMCYLCLDAKGFIYLYAHLHIHIYLYICHIGVYIHTQDICYTCSSLSLPLLPQHDNMTIFILVALKLFHSTDSPFTQWGKKRKKREKKKGERTTKKDKNKIMKVKGQEKTSSSGGGSSSR